MTSTAFAHGVASGDPLSDGVVLWTRVSTAAPRSVAVGWAVARDADLRDVVASGHADARAEDDFTVHVDVRGLSPATSYFYAFTADGARSRVGRTRTAPAGRTERLRVGVTSCAKWTRGFFNVYGCLARRDLDLVVHLGDYYYERGEPDVRRHEPPGTAVTLADYRGRHAQHKTDEDLQALHARHPVVATWDDHEFAGDAAFDDAEAHDPVRHGDWAARRDAAARAYFEWMPVRRPDRDDPLRIYRHLPLGDLADLLVLDTRLGGRDAQAAARPVVAVRDPDRSLLGARQRAWLQDHLGRSDARWRLLANQVMLSPLRGLHVPQALRRLLPRTVAGGVVVNPGQWDGYPHERAELLAFLRDRRIGDVVVLTGDLHSSWAVEVTDDPGRTAPVAVEFVTPSVTADPFAEAVFPPLPGGARLFAGVVRAQNPHVRFAETRHHGYVVLDVTADDVTAEYWHVATVRARDHRERLVAAWKVDRGEPRLRPGPAGPRR